MMAKIFLVNLVLSIHLLQRVLSIDIIPTVFKDSTWIDNTKGDVTFTIWEMEGLQFSVDNQDVSVWEVVDRTRFNSDTAKDEPSYLALRTTESFDYSAATYYGFVCIKFYKLSEDSYKYYRLHDTNSIAGGERVKLDTNHDLTRFEDICNTAYTYNNAQYGIWIKRGSGPKSTCPNPILGRFGYTMTHEDGTTGCASNDTLWDGCTDNKIIAFNYTICTDKVAYSVGGKLTCLDSIVYNNQNHYQVYLYNLDKTVDNINTFHFSCIRVTEDGKEISIAPRYCRTQQTPFDISQENGKDIGQKLTTTALCIYPGKDGGLSTGVIIGIGVGAVIIICINFMRCSCGKMST